MAGPYADPTIDEYLRERLMPVEGAIPHLPGIEMYGNSIPAGTVGGDLFEYINFQQRYDIDARIERALQLSKEFLSSRPTCCVPHLRVQSCLFVQRAQVAFSETPSVGRPDPTAKRRLDRDRGRRCRP